MRQIRNSVFETNSSSMHSLVIKKSNEYYSEQELYTNIWLHDGVWRIYDEEYIRFGRFPFRCLETFEGKVRYAIASLCSWRSDAKEIFNNIESLVTEIIPECRSIQLPKERYFSDNEEHIYYGGVDDDILTPFLNRTGISLKEFLTNKKYIVIVDGDEYCIWESLKDSGLINVDEIEEEYN